MKSLLVFDGNIPLQKILRCLPVGQSVHLFPLTGDWDVIDRIKAYCDATGRSVRVLDAARSVDVAVETLRKRVGPWSENLGRRSVAGRSLREWLMTPGGETSAWWFTLLSEKNPLKTDVFLKIAQLNAVDDLLSSCEYGFCLVASTDRGWGKAVASAASRHSVPARRLCSFGPLGWRARGKDFLKWAGPWGDISMGLFRLSSFAVRGVLARWVMGAFPKRKRHPLSLLCVTYFPALDRSAAETGEFVNRFSGPLQDFLRRQGRQVNWLLMAVPYDGFGFAAALKMGRFFASVGEAIFFLEEFFGPKQMWACVRSWAKLMWVYRRITRSVGARFWSGGLAVPEADPLLARLWRRSTLGDVGVEGVAFLECFKGAFNGFSDATACLYFLEMQAWEKALNAARRGHTKAVTIGFQHSAFSKNHFSHFHTAGEISSRGQPGGLPLPDVLGCNGDVSRKIFVEQGHVRVRCLEALRHFHLMRPPEGIVEKKKPPVLLLIGASDKEGMKSLLSMAIQAFPHPAKFEVWVKPHPGGRLDKVLREMCFEGPESLPFKVVHDPMPALLKASRVVAATDSSASVEAVGFGCRVILPVMSNVLSMNALMGHEGFYEKVYNPSEFSLAVERCLSSEISDDQISAGRRLVASFWNLDEALPAWRELFLNVESGSVF